MCFQKGGTAMLRRLLTYFKPYKGLLALDLVCAFLLAGFDLFYPTITGKIIDIYIPRQMLQQLVFWLCALLTKVDRKSVV